MIDWPEGYERLLLDSVDSTNAEAVRQVPGRIVPVWIMAREQTAARGRRGRPWRNPAGNFAATLVLFLDEAVATGALRSFVAGLAVHDAIIALTGRSEGLAVKWPNDVLLNGGKVSGILLETLPLRGPGAALAIGIGVNLRAAPGTDELEEGATRPVSVLSETGCAVAPEAFLGALAQAFAGYEAQLRQYGFAPIRQAFLTRAARLGQVITARTTREVFTGTFETVDETGQLVLSTAKGRVLIPAADIFF